LIEAASARFSTFRLTRKASTELRVVFIEEFGGSFEQLDVSLLMVDCFDFGLLFNFGWLGG
jgi:hypothetical protein